MPKKSKIIEEIKEQEIQYFRDLSPQQRLDIAVSHNSCIKSIFGLGLKSRGFSDEEINALWIKKMR